MGQRLNIEIFNNGQVLANAYYHWSAFTTTALELVDEVLKAYKEDMQSDDERQKAVWALQATGAGLTDDEKKSIYAKDLKKLTECQGRDFGLIAVSDKGISDTRYWEEDRVTIYLDEQRIDFEVIWKERNYEYDKDTKVYLEDRPLFEDLPIIEWNLSDIKFKDFELFKRFMEEMIEEKKLHFRTKQYPCIAYSIID